MSKKESSTKATDPKNSTNTDKVEPTTSDKTQIAIKSKKKDKPSISLEGKCIKGRYQLENKIGSGGMSDIYRAKDLFLEKAGIKDVYVAIKVLQQQFVDQPEALQLLLKEADKTRQLSHPNIIRVYDVDSDEDTHFLVMEYLDGETLDQIIKRSKPKGLKLDGAIKLLSQMSDALRYAHKAGIIHTDLKPANIILTRDGHIKLLDFGVARVLQMNHDKYAAENQNLTAPNGGYTPAYASPELLAGNMPSVEDDIFSFACVAYELLTSKHPFERLPADKALKEKKVAQKPKHLSFAQWKALNKALSFDKKLRTPKIELLTQALTNNPWPKTAIAASIVTVLAAGGWYGFQQQTVIENTQQSLAELQLHQDRINNLEAMPSEQFLLQLPKLEKSSPFEREGLLRSHRSGILSAYEKRVDIALNDREHEYPNYPVAEKLLIEVSELYPDSHTLAKQAINIQRGKQATLEALSGRLHSLLRKAQYSISIENDDVYKLLDELRYIESTYNPRPTVAEVNTYKSEFNAAIKEHNAPRLEELINVGAIIFNKTEDTQELLAVGKQLKEAVNKLATYQAETSEGNEATYPYQAATVFYRDSFDGFNQRLEGSRTVARVDDIFNEMETLSKELPSDFSPLIDLRKKMANKYLSLADELLKKRRVRTANKVMRRANNLIISTNI